MEGWWDTIVGRCEVEQCLPVQRAEPWPLGRAAGGLVTLPTELMILQRVCHILCGSIHVRGCDTLDPVSVRSTPYVETAGDGLAYLPCFPL
jgi:hypothetical protein